MMQSRTHNCGELRAQHAGEHVKLVGWMENVREVGGSLAFVVLRDFYGTTQIVVETSELLAQIKGYNKESTISVEGTVRERASKNPNQPTGDIEVVPEKIELLARLNDDLRRAVEVAQDNEGKAAADFAHVLHPADELDVLAGMLRAKLAAVVCTGLHHGKIHSCLYIIK